MIQKLGSRGSSVCPEVSYHGRGHAPCELLPEALAGGSSVKNLVGTLVYHGLSLPFAFFDSKNTCSRQAEHPHRMSRIKCCLWTAGYIVRHLFSRLVRWLVSDQDKQSTAAEDQEGHFSTVPWVSCVAWSACGAFTILVTDPKDIQRP